jgi:ferredoxin
MADVTTSATHRASGATIKVDRTTCISAASCVSIAPGTFQLDQTEGKVMVVDPDTENVAQILDAAKSCPVNAITIVDKDGRQLWPPA